MIPKHTTSRVRTLALSLVCVFFFTSDGRSCENLTHFGNEMLLGFYFGDSPSDVFCQAKKSSPNSALRLDLTNRCRGNRFIGLSRPLTQQSSFQNALSDLYSQALKFRTGNAVDKQLFSMCYDIEGLAMAGIIKGSDQPAMFIAPLLEADFVIENLAAFDSGNFRATFGFTDHALGAYERVNFGLAFLMARMKGNQELALIQVDKQRLYPIWYLSSIELVSYPPRTIEALEKVRKSALGLFKRVHELYPGRIDQGDNADLIIRRNPADLFLKFDEQKGIVSIRSKINAGPQFMDESTREIYNWVVGNRVRSR